MADVTIAMTLSTTQARAFLRYQLNQYEVLMAEVWHSDRYRTVPEGMRGPRVLKDYPHIAGLHRSIRALRKQLQEAQA
ncbi:hypothetical protein JLK41_12165 [Ectopseudomonas khazarica]|uniref:hypothetical protein n=1 Tax=Ectopseudomonas khazarica TaxID=2502979 RepID=UPI0006479E8F|nr:hypothetical protein [Pseudomonas khazarica]QTS88851.1 hypothetical protein JLK41_12165 [Pseudomonas khazarica]